MQAFYGFDRPGSTVLTAAFIAVVIFSALGYLFWRQRRQTRSLASRSRELERLSTELFRVNRMKSEFLANVSHELRTPLNAIVGFVDLLRQGVYGDLTPRQAKPVERIEASATHLRHLVDQILDLGRIAAGRLEVHVEPVDLRSFLLDVASEMEPLVNEKALRLTLRLGSTVPQIRTDPVHLRQIMLNLLGNSVRYTSAGSITIGVSVTQRLPDWGSVNPGLLPSATWVGLHVSDTGVGIAASDQKRIFEEFEQVEAGSRTNSSSRGTGLGLAISRRLSEAMGGRIDLDSEPGKGSTFTLWLPHSLDSFSPPQ